eukprot:5001185-Prymnesium_polylepis.1
MPTPAPAAPHAPAYRAPRTRPAGTVPPPRPAAAQTDCRGRPPRRAPASQVACSAALAAGASPAAPHAP